MIFKKKQAASKQAKGGKKKTKLPPISKVVRPGAQVSIVLSVDLVDEVIDARSSTLHAIDKNNRLILAQTEPPLAPRMVGQQLEISFLARDLEDPAQPWIRLGYSTKLLSIVNDVRLGEGLVDNILVVDGPKKLTPTTVRLYYRLEPRADDGFELHLEPDHQKVNLEDISAGGLRFNHPPNWRLTQDQTLFLSLKRGDWQINLESRVVRSAVINLGKAGRIGQTAVEFQKMDMYARRDISRILNKISRGHLLERSGMSSREPDYF